MLGKLKRLGELAYYFGEYISLSFMPRESIGPISRWFFKSPLLLHKLGLGKIVSNQVLLISTTGRKSGKTRMTPVGYSYDPDANVYYVVAGWRGHTHWYQNALVNPHVRVQIDNSIFNAVAQPAHDDVVMRLLTAYARRNPFATRLYWKEAGIRFDGTDDSLRELTAYYPTLALHVQRD